VDLLTPVDFNAWAVDQAQLGVYIADVLREVQRVIPTLQAAAASDPAVAESASSILRAAVLRRIAAGPVPWTRRSVTKGPFAESVTAATGAWAILAGDELAGLLALVGAAPASPPVALPRGTFPPIRATGSW